MPEPNGMVLHSNGYAASMNYHVLSKTLKGCVLSLRGMIVDVLRSPVCLMMKECHCVELYSGCLNSTLFITSLATRLFTFELNVIVGVVFR